MEGTSGYYHHAEPVHLHLVNLTLAKITEFAFEMKDPDLIFDFPGMVKDFKNTHLLPFGGSAWKLFTISPTQAVTPSRILKPAVKERNLRIKFHFEATHKVDIPDDWIDVTFTEEDNKTTQNHFNYEVEHKLHDLDENGRKYHVLEITIRNTSDHDKICAAEVMFKMGENLFAMGNNADALENIKNAKDLLSSTDPSLKGDLAEVYGKVDAKVYCDDAKILIAQYFAADKKFDYYTAFVKLDGAVKAINEAVNIDPDNEEYKQVKLFIDDIVEWVDHFELARDNLAGSLILEMDRNFEYCQYHCQIAIEILEDIVKCLDKWKDNPLKIKGIDKECFVKYPKKLAGAKQYLVEIKQMFAKQEDEDYDRLW